MTAKELIDKLDPQTRENLWDIFIDNDEYITDSEIQNKEVNTWDLEYGLCEKFFQLTLKIYTVDYVPYFFEREE